MAAHAMWKGVVRLGGEEAERVPVKLYAAIEDLGVHFRLLHAEDGAPVRQEAVDVVELPAEGGEEAGGGSIIDIMDVLRRRLGVKAAGGGDGDETGGSEMPKAWTDKDERQYEHVKESEKERGRSDARAKEIAARTVNKQRREEGRTPNKTTQGTGNPNTGLEARTKDELYNRAKELDIDGRSKMSKEELIRAIRKAS